MRRTMESVAAERLNKIGIRDQNFVGNGSASDNEATSVSQDAQEMSAIVSALGTIHILCQHILGLFWPTHPICQYGYSTDHLQNLPVSEPIHFIFQHEYSTEHKKVSFWAHRPSPFADNEATWVSQDAQEMSAIVSTLGNFLILHQQKDCVGGWVVGLAWPQLNSWALLSSEMNKLLAPSPTCCT